MNTGNAIIIFDAGGLKVTQAVPVKHIIDFFGLTISVVQSDGQQIENVIFAFCNTEIYTCSAAISKAVIGLALLKLSEAVALLVASGVVLSDSRLSLA